MKDIIIIVVILLLIGLWVGWLQLSSRAVLEEVLPEEILTAEEVLLPDETGNLENIEYTENEAVLEESAGDEIKDITDEEKITETEKETEIEKEPETFVQCLADEGVIIYGMRTCPACKQLADSFGGYDAISLIYVECTEEQERCRNEMKTKYVPEIQIMAELYKEGRTPEALAKTTGCAI